MEEFDCTFRPLIEHNAYVIIIKSDYSVVRRWDFDAEDEKLEKEHGKKVCKSIYSSIKGQTELKTRSILMEILEKVLNS
jgi:hypothetical protein